MLENGEVFSKLSRWDIRHTGVEVVIGEFWDFSGERWGDTSTASVLVPPAVACTLRSGRAGAPLTATLMHPLQAPQRVHFKATMGTERQHEMAFSIIT